MSRCSERESGGRVIDAILSQTLLPTVSEAILSRLLEGHTISRVRVGVEDGQFAYDFA